jgi:regulator of replication initiation timing
VVLVVIPTIKQRIQIVGEERALSETEAWVDGLLAENKRLKYQQDQLRLVLGSGEPLHVDYETLLELAQLFKQDLEEARAVKKFLFEENERLKSELENARKASIIVTSGSSPACLATPVLTYTYVVFGEECVIYAQPWQPVKQLLPTVLEAMRASATSPWELYTANGRRIGDDETLESAGPRIIVSLPIGHGG